MKKYTLDTNIISYLLKGNKNLSAILKKKIKEGNIVIINLITYYEICRGLLAINNLDKLEKFKDICNSFETGSITINTIYRAAIIYADLKRHGKLIDDADIFIASICMEDNLILVTNNEKHFQRIKGLKLENWVV